MAYKNKEEFSAAQKRIRDRNREFANQYLKDHPCVMCGESDVRVLEFDHIDPATKRFCVSSMVSSQHRSVASILAEIEKCQVLCANCHRKKTFTERGITWGRARI